MMQSNIIKKGFILLLVTMMLVPASLLIGPKKAEAAISFVAGASANSTTVSLPGTAEAGDLAIVVTGRSNTGGSSIPNGWTDLGVIAGGSGGSAHGQRAGWKILTSSDITAGNVDTWSNAGTVQVLVYRGASGVHSTNHSGTGASSNTITFPARSSLGSGSWVVGVATHRSATNVSGVTATDYTNRSSGFTSTSAGGMDTNGSVASVVQRTATVNASSGNVGRTVEVEALVPVTTLGDGTDPSNTTLAPGASVTDLDAFTLVTNSGTDAVTALTVTLAPSGAFNNIAKVEITNTSNTDVCTDIDNPSGLTLNFSCSGITGIGTTPVSYKVRVTPKTHANMPAVPGASYAVTGTVTAFTSTNTQAGTDTDSATLTIDNLSPDNVPDSPDTSLGVSDGEIGIGWDTEPSDSDFTQTLVFASTSAVTFTPVEGATYTVGTLSGDSRVACVAAKFSFGCTDTNVVNGTAYHYKIFTKDTNGNYAATGVVPTGSPATPTSPTFTQQAYKFSATSTSDGATWAAQSVAGDNDSWRSVTYGNGLFVAVSSFGDSLMTSPDGVTWTVRSAAENNGWASVTYGNGTFVAVSYDGANRVMTSTNGITWTPVSAAGNNDTWNSITYGNGLFVAVSSLGDKIMTSATGTSWTVRTSPDTNGLLSVTYGNGLFVAVGYAGEVATSPDGIDWTPQTAAAANDWYGITYGNGLFVAVSHAIIGTIDNRVMTSTNGTDWTARSAAENNHWTSVAYGNGLFVAVAIDGTNRVMTSSDGTTWTPRSAVANEWAAITYGNGLFVALAETGSNRVMTSGTAGPTVGAELAATSTAATLTSAGQRFRLRNLVRVDTASLSANSSRAFKLQYAEKSGTCDVSFTGETYADVTSSTPIAFYNNPDFFHGTTTVATTTDPIDSSRTIRYQKYSEENNINTSSFITAGQTGLWDFSLYDNGASANTAYCLRLVQSTDAQSWTAQSADLVSWYSVTYGNSLFVAVASSGTKRVMTSPDGITWTAHNAAGDDDTWKSITYANGLFVAVANSGNNRVMTSPDGITWTPQDASDNNDTWWAVTYGNGLFVAVGSSGDRVMTSPDGIAWTARSAAGNDDPFYHVAYGNGVFVAVGDFGDRVITSSDGINWTARRSANDQRPWESVTYGNGLFVAVATANTSSYADICSTGCVMTSRDGVNWATSTTPISGWWYDVNYGNGLFVAVGYTDIGSTMLTMTSPDGITWTARSAADDNDSWRSVVYGNGLFVAVSSFGTRVITSDIGHSTLDTYTVIPEITTATAGAALTQLHYRWRNDDGSESTATYAVAEDTALTSGIYRGDGIRLRFLVSNSGTSASGYTYLLEHASTSCSAWFTVPTTAGTSHWVMYPSAHISNGSATTDSSGLTNPEGTSFVAGFTQTTANQTSVHTLDNNKFTEFEYAMQSTLNASTGTTYCFRLTNAGSATGFTYSQEPQIALASTVRPSGGGGGGSNKNAGGEADAPPDPAQGGGGESGGGSAGGEGGESPAPPQGGGGGGGGGGGDVGILRIFFIFAKGMRSIATAVVAMGN